MNDRKRLGEQIDWFSTIVPLAGVMALCAVFMAMPEQSAVILQAVRGFLGDDCGIYYALLGTGIFGCTMYMAFSRFGRIRLGNAKKPQYPAFQWGNDDFYIYHGRRHFILFPV